MAHSPIFPPGPKPGPFMTLDSANQFNEQAVFQAHVITSICRVTEYHEFIFTDVPETWAEDVLQLIDERIPSRKCYNSKSRALRVRVMPTEIHNCIQPWVMKQVIDWLVNQDITRQEEELLEGGVGLTLEFKNGPYRGSRKEPDFFLRVDGQTLPSLAVETGWSESMDELREDMNLLLVGGNGSIKVVILVKWTRSGDCVSGMVEVYMRDRNGMPKLEQIETIFPRPATASSQRIGIQRRDLFGPALVRGRNGNDILYLDIDRLRNPVFLTGTRNQLVLNVALPEVQDFIIESVSNILDSADITYVKWDNNRGMHQTPSPSTDHAYMLGLYRVFDTLTTKYPNVLWEGCASGGGRFDLGVLQYFPQIWTSDDTDAMERITIQLGTSLAYPPSAMGVHLSAVPKQQTGRTLPVAFRTHVAMMGGSFGLKLNPADMPEEDRAVIPGLIALAEKVNPIVLHGDMYRLSLPEDLNWPAVLFIAPGGKKAVLFYFQMSPSVNHALPRVKMQGLDPQAMYCVDGEATYSGATLMNLGLQFAFPSYVGSKVVLLEKQ